MSATLKAAIYWIAHNDDADLGDEAHGFILTIYLVADLFSREPHEIAWAVEAEREGKGWRLGRKAGSQ
jgi:hypothetical protein